MKNFKSIILILTLCFLTSFLVSCGKKTDISKPLSKTELVIGTVCTISIYDNQDMKILDKCFDRLKELEDILSINKTDTELQKVNQAAGKTPIKVSDETLDVVIKGLEYSKLSNGALDITVGPLVKLWGIGTDSARVPSQSEIDEKKSLIDYSLLELDKTNKTIFLKKEGMIIDLGSIAKGYAADEIAELLTENKISSAVIDLGGNIFAMGSKIDGSDWKIGVQNPDAARNDSIGFLKVSNKSVVTSGIYERYFEANGKHYHHILNPETGFPYENEVLGVSIITDKSVDGDSLSTTLFALGVDKGLELINSMDGVDAIFITKNKDLYVSSGIKSIFTLTNNEFTIKN